MYLNIRIVKRFFILLFIGVNSVAFSQTIYTNDMDYVLGDVKQRFITKDISTQEEADNLLKGFTTMKVNGIRLPIFPAGWDYNKDIMQYFFTQAKSQGFLIYANPAQDSGARRIASGTLLSADLIATNNNAAATATVISTVSQFALDYPGLKWINPFNEDGRPGGAWTAAQINAIYSGVKANLESYFTAGQIPNVPELIGPCSWGIPASIDMLNNSNIGEYITVASSHNLGSNDSSWSTFIAAANNNTTNGVSNPLPVWDSEVNNSVGRDGGTTTRIDAAIANKVDGLVIYNSGNNIFKGSGELTALNELYMSKYLKDETIEDLGVNVAPNGTATQSSVGYAGATSDKAIDGITDGLLADNSLSIIRGDDTPPYWEVDLGANKEIGYIRIYNRTDNCCKNRLENFTVYVMDNNRVITFSKTYTSYPDPSVTMEVNKSGQIVRVESDATDGTALNLAEVEVYESTQLSIENYEDIKVNLSPNPFLDNLKITSPNADFNSISIYNINGQKILSTKVEADLSDININTSKFSKGIYMIKLNGVNFSKTYKIVKE
ncbi:Por secretion system C-terminal sorting domain-containing protein [Polaribacter sp. KT25b]|uniref:galactose-binding domain-containing protein n=1 Tax=Polaribacter sp. KT25b TaxID=1855336 RepID=UPI00087C5E61|nr:T9SS type A sorting domain-containing protein [Polaribacter sp. KT25b]SDS58915.1 Por secretion system C-terminal sorting domain-containing protein [Polaribacter sp. KT25b]